MHAGDPTVEVGDAGNHRRPGLGWKVFVRSIVAARMEAQAAAMIHLGYSPTLQIGFDHGSFYRLRYCKQASCRLLRSSDWWQTSRFRNRLRFRTRQFQKSPRLLRDLAEVPEPKTLSDDVEQIAVLGGRGVCPFAGRSLRRVVEPHEHRTARTIVDIAHQPVPPFALAVGEIVAAHRLGLTRETACQFGSI